MRWCASRCVRRGAVLLLLPVLALGACSRGGDGPPPQRTREAAGPTLADAPPPTGWTDVRSPTGLVYSVPPDWASGDRFSGDPLSGDPRPASGVDWGSGFVTQANAVADRGYCRSNSASFRVLAGIASPVSGHAREQVTSAARSLADSVDRRFTRNGADSPVPEPVKIGVSGTAAWHVTVRGKVHPPRDECTPPVIRIDAIAVDTTGGDGAPATLLFVLMADEEEPGVVPRETVDAVLASLRFDNSV